MHDNPACRLFGVYENETGLLCGFCDVWERGRYLPLSSLKTRVSRERQGVNFALVHGILEYYKNQLTNGAYLCDGARNALHETNFQPFLEKYFGFRKAYCRLHIELHPFIKPAFAMLFPMRHVFKNTARRLNALMKMYAWSKGQPK